MKYKTLLYIVTVLFVHASCKYRYLSLVGTDFGTDSQKSCTGSVEKVKTFFQDDETHFVYKYYFCENTKPNNGILLKSYEQCNEIKDSSKIQRVISLVFLDNHRVLYLSSNYDWNKIERFSRTISLDEHFTRVREGNKCKKYPNCSVKAKGGKKAYTCYRGYYTVNNSSIVVKLDVGKVVSRKKRDKLKRYKTSFDKKEKNETDIDNIEKYKRFHKRKDTTQLFFSFSKNILVLDSLKYRDEDYGIDEDTPLTKKINAIYETPLRFHLSEYKKSDPIYLSYKGKDIKKISCHGNKRIYVFADGQTISEGYDDGNIDTW